MNETNTYRTLLFLIKGEQVLLARKKRGYGVDKLNGVGGKVELGEMVEEAMIREAQEEINVLPLHYWQVAELNFEEYEDGELQHVNVYVYFCDQWEGEPSESEEMTPLWSHREIIPYEQMWSNDAYWLPLVLRDKKIKGRFVSDKNGVLLSKDLKEVMALDCSAIQG